MSTKNQNSMVPLRRHLKRQATARRKSFLERSLKPWLPLVHLPERDREPFALHPRRDHQQMNRPGANSAIWPAVCQLAGNDHLTLRVSGHCMEPFLENEARITVRRSRPYLPGDVLVVTRPSGRPVVHRLIGLFPARGSLRYLTQGDNSPAPDGSFTGDAILGKVCGGQCSPLAVTIPLRHRAKAVGRFVSFLGTRLRQRTWSLLKTT